MGITAHDIYFKTRHNWKRMVHNINDPIWQRRSRFSVLDITNPAKPDHLILFNDYVLKKVHFVDHNEIESRDYIATFYPLASFSESIRATDNAQDSSKSKPAIVAVTPNVMKV